jgi:thymidylate synthase
MDNYLNFMRYVYENGSAKVVRNGYKTRAIFGGGLSFDLANGFPAVTTKQLYFKSVAAELAGFLEGTTSVSRMRELGTKIWDANTAADHWQNNPKCQGPDDMGRIYGVQWRNFGGVDQLRNVVDQLIKDPSDRRMIVSAWNPPELDSMCLPPCHIFYQFNVIDDRLNCLFYMRSLDIFLGAPFDIASYALLTHIVAQQVDLVPGVVSMMVGDAHIYEDHFAQVEEQLSRPMYDLPKLYLSEEASIDNFHPDMAQLVDYKYHPAIKAEMAV